MAYPTAGPSRSYNLHQDLPAPPPVLPAKLPSPYESPSHSPNPDSGWNTINGNGHSQMRESGAADDRAALEASKRNPLVDLMDSEKTYVEQLALVIRVRSTRPHPEARSANGDCRGSLQHGQERTSLHRNWTPCFAVWKRSIVRIALSAT